MRMITLHWFYQQYFAIESPNNIFKLSQNTIIISNQNCEENYFLPFL